MEVNDRHLQPLRSRDCIMAADPTILKRIRSCPFARGGRVLVRFRANGYNLFDRRSGMPLVRLRLADDGDDVVVLYPSHRGGWEPPGDLGAPGMPLNLTLERLSANPYFLELRQAYSEPRNTGAPRNPTTRSL
jgi:hypothetical protein